MSEQEQDTGEGWQDRAPAFTDPARPDQEALRVLAYIVASLGEVERQIQRALTGLQQAASHVREQVESLRYDLAAAESTLAEVVWVPDPYGYELWQHPDTGTRYAVRLSDGVVIGAALYDLGTATFEDLQGRLYENQALAAWCHAHRGEFVTVPLITQEERAEELRAWQVLLREAKQE